MFIVVIHSVSVYVLCLVLTVLNFFIFYFLPDEFRLFLFNGYMESAFRGVSQFKV